MTKVTENPTENESYPGETADLTREKISDVLLTMGVITPEERRGTKYVRVEEDGSISFNRDFMVNVLKDGNVEISPKMKDRDIAKMFAEMVLGDEFEFFVGNAKINAMETTKSSAKMKHKHIKLPEAA